MTRAKLIRVIRNLYDQCVEADLHDEAMCLALVATVVRRKRAGDMAQLANRIAADVAGHAVVRETMARTSRIVREERIRAGA